MKELRRSDCQTAKNGRLKVRRLQRVLYLKSKQEETFRFYSLYDKLWCLDVLWEAWRQVKSNKGAPGIEDVAIETIEMQGEAGEMLSRLQQQLCEKRYPFSPVRQVDIPKPKGGTRPLGINTVEDRIVQTAMKIVIEPIFEAGFHDCSYGYRPKRSAKQASIAIREDLYKRSWGVVEIDFKTYFTSIPHAKLLKQSLKIGVDEGGIITPTTRGVPQGSPLSPLYSNIYLNLIDRLWHKRGYPVKRDATLHRYGDDAILVCRKSAYPALAAFKAIAKQMELTLHEEKTHITKLTDGFDFLGFHFVKRKSPTSGKNTIYLFPAKSAQQKIRNRLKYRTCRRAPISPEGFTALVKPVVRGWVNYFRHTNASDAFRRLQRFVNTRFRRYLTHRSKGRGFGWKQYPNSKLYAMGLIYIGSGMLEYSAEPVQDLR